MAHMNVSALLWLVAVLDFSHVVCSVTQLILIILLLVIGRIRAIQLDYSESHRHLIQAIRKAPQSGAIGFKQTVRK